MDYEGCTPEVFTVKALDEIHKASVGIPHMVNRICEKAFMYAFQNQNRLIDDYMIKFIIEHEMPTWNHNSVKLMDQLTHTVRRSNWINIIRQ